MTNHIYTGIRILDKKQKKVIVDLFGDIINRNPTKEELKDLRPELSRQEMSNDKDILLEFLRYFNDKEGRPPSENDFKHNRKRPSYMSYVNMFGNWNSALKQVELDVDSMVKKGTIMTNDQKARFAELKIIDHFKHHPIDLAGKNKNNPYDGICPNGNIYDVKSSKLYKIGNRYHYQFATNNKYKDEIEIYYFLGFNEDYTILEHAWRIPGEMVDGNYFYIASRITKIYNNNTRDIESMKRYIIITLGILKV